MNSNKSTINIIEPSKEIFELIEFYKSIVSKALPDSKITLIGSFAIPMCGKEEFDLLIEVDDVKKSQEIIQEKSQGRIGIGPIIDEEGFCRSKKRFGIICELHIVPKNHKRIRQYRNLINKLQSDSQLIKEYSELKQSLDGSSELKYKREKIKFLEKHNLTFPN
jgi:GrpB-like predicted nucleotidyltransferase (UPF0157 family)